MRKPIFLLLLTLTLGCTTVAFHQPGKTATDFEREMMACRKKAVKSTPIEMYSGDDMDALPKVTGKEIDCMREHGWALSHKPGGFPFRPLTLQDLTHG